MSTTSKITETAARSKLVARGRTDDNGTQFLKEYGCDKRKKSS